MTVLMMKYLPSRALRGGRASRTSFLALMMFWIERARTRRRLAELTPELLRDVGLTDTDVVVEREKPFWH